MQLSRGLKVKFSIAGLGLFGRIWVLALCGRLELYSGWGAGFVSGWNPKGFCVLILSRVHLSLSLVSYWALRW